MGGSNIEYSLRSGSPPRPVTISEEVSLHSAGLAAESALLLNVRTMEKGAAPSTLDTGAFPDNR